MRTAGRKQQHSTFRPNRAENRLRDPLGCENLTAIGAKRKVERRQLVDGGEHVGASPHARTPASPSSSQMLLVLFRSGALETRTLEQSDSSMGEFSCNGLCFTCGVMAVLRDATYLKLEPSTNQSHILSSTNSSPGYRSTRACTMARLLAALGLMALALTVPILASSDTQSFVRAIKHIFAI